MLWNDINFQVNSKMGGSITRTDSRPVIFVDTNKQLLLFVSPDESQFRSYPVSTALNGVGNLVDSGKTPDGVHRIKQKIGAEEPCGMVFKSRVATGYVSDKNDNRDEDEITSRILWLDGLEQGVNKGGSCDTFSRYIYIHGTSDEKRIGEAVSHGCIRMKNEDVIELFNAVHANDIVFIR